MNCVKATRSSVSYQYNFVYFTRNILTRDLYIGVHSTKDLSDGYLGSGLRLRRAIGKYGRENFVVTSRIHYHSLKEAYLAEKRFVTREFLKEEYSYNLKAGGIGGCGEHSEATRNKIREANTGKVFTQQRRENISKSLKGKFEGDKNPMFGISSEQLMSPQKVIEKRRKQSLALKGLLIGEKNPMHGRSCLDNMTEDAKASFIRKARALCQANSKRLAEERKGQPWRNPAVSGRNLRAWSCADIAHCLIRNNPDKGFKALNTKYGSIGVYIPLSLYRKVVTENWNPCVDSRWVNFFKEKQ